MNESVGKLYSIARKDTRKIIGLMSGTSLDGLDVALCELKGNGTTTKLSLLKFVTVNYEPGFKKAVREIFSRKKVELEKVCLLNEWIALHHAAIINECLYNWNISKEDVDLIASHGQTIYHAPQSSHGNKAFPNGTMQIGDGDHIAVKTGIITISDFRQKHIAAGGEGAPLAAYGDFLLFSEKNNNVVLLNIGGIANFTYLPAGAVFNKMVCTDTGPGNTIMDAWIQKKFPGKYFDDDAAIALAGNVHRGLLSTLKDNDFLRLPFSKSTGPELFNTVYLENAIHKNAALELKPEDVMATLNLFTAETICDAIDRVTGNSADLKILLSGGGIYNPLLMKHITDHFKNASIHTTAEKNIHPDAKEAILFAVLANECVAGNGTNFGSGSDDFPAITMGKISFPK